MLIALLVVLGVNLAVVVGFASLVIGRRMWLKRQPGAFGGGIRVVNGEVEGLGPKWKKGSGRWVREILVWNRAPFMYRTDLIPIDAIAGSRQPDAGEKTRSGDNPLVVILKSGDNLIEVATTAETKLLAMGPFSLSSPELGG